MLSFFQVGQGAGHPENPVVGASAEVELGHRAFEKSCAFCIDLAMTFHLSGRHPTVPARRVGLGFCGALALQVTCRLDSGPDHGASFARFTRGEVAVFDERHLDVQIDPVEQWSGDSLAVFRDLVG